MRDYAHGFDFVEVPGHVEFASAGGDTLFELLDEGR